MTRPLDTSAAAWEAQMALLRAMTPEQRFMMARNLTIALQQAAFSVLRSRYPDHR